MRSVSAKNADSNFGALIEGSGRAGTVVKYGRPAVVELAVEEYARLKGSEAPQVILLDFQYFHEASDHRPGTVHYLHDRAKSSEKFAVIDTFVAESDFPLDELHESEDAAGGSSLQHSTIAEKPTLHPRAPEDRK